MFSEARERRVDDLESVDSSVSELGLEDAGDLARILSEAADRCLDRIVCVICDSENVFSFSGTCCE